VQASRAPASILSCRARVSKSRAQGPSARPSTIVENDDPYTTTQLVACPRQPRQPRSRPRRPGHFRHLALATLLALAPLFASTLTTPRRHLATLIASLDPHYSPLRPDYQTWPLRPLYSYIPYIHHSPPTLAPTNNRPASALTLDPHPRPLQPRHYHRHHTRPPPPPSSPTYRAWSSIWPSLP
jgi:hypothetical protein